MTRTRLALMAAVATMTITSGYAFADSNKANVTQSGNSNSAEVNQLGGRFNTTNATQTNDTDSASNTLTVTQSGGYSTVNRAVQNSELGTGSNEAVITQQTGNVNRVVNLKQTVNADGSNSATILEDGGNNRIDRVTQNNTGPLANTISVSIVGAANGSTYLPETTPSGTSWIQQQLSGYAAASTASNGTLLQDGTGNDISLSITGDHNQFGVTQKGTNSLSALAIDGSDNQLGVYQESTAAGPNSLTIAAINGDDNNIGAYQYGANTGTINLDTTSNRNTVLLHQSGDNTGTVSISNGSDNSISLVQDGTNSADIAVARSFNEIYATQIGTNLLDADVEGNFNNFTINQTTPNGTLIGAQNELTLSVYGNSNGLRSWRGNVAHDVGLTAGTLTQTGLDNTATISVGSSSSFSANNVLALAQIGDSNSIAIDISAGNSNQVAISQTGDSNSSSVTQVGSDNVVGISQ